MAEALMAFWATLGSFLVQLVAPEAGGSGSAENKGTLGHDGVGMMGMGMVGMGMSLYSDIGTPLRLRKGWFYTFFSGDSWIFRIFPTKNIWQSTL